MPTSPADGTVSVLILRALVLGARAHGIDPLELGRQSGVAVEQLTKEALGDPDARVPARHVLALWHSLPALTQNENFGLWLAEKAGAAPITPAGWFIQSSPTLAEGLERAVRFQRLLHDASQSELRRDASGLRYVHRIGDRAFRAPRHAIEFGFAQAVLLVRNALGEAVMPAHVHFMHAEPKDLTQHRSLFGDGLRFAQESDELAFDTQTAERSIPTRNDALGELILAHSRLLLDRLPSDASWGARVRGAIVEALPRELLGLEHVAKTLSATKRTLQRRLAEEGTSFDEILDQVRKELAARYLREQQLSAQECAFLLGYSDLSAFHRAFARWHGVAPGQFRKVGAS